MKESIPASAGNKEALTKPFKPFQVNQSNASDILFEFEAPKTKDIVEQKNCKGMLYMFISAAFFTTSAALLKYLYLYSDISTYEFTYWQSIVIGILNLFLFKTYQKDHMLVRDDMRSTLVIRSILAFLGSTGFYLALQYTDLSKATALYWTNPMMTAVVAYLVLNESLPFIDWIAILVSFAGILVIQNPWAKGYAENRSYEETVGSLAAIGGALFYAIAQMQTRKLGKKVHFLVPPFYQAIFSAFISPLLMILFLRYRTAHTTHYGWYEVSMIILISICIFIAQVFTTKAFQNDKAGRIAPVSQLQIIFNWAIDFVLIGTQPNTNELIGGGMIIGSNFLISLLRCFDLIK
jgi:drug/metabolite transporter (DMT)-like permease